jgi:hypothetical protein
MDRCGQAGPTEVVTAPADIVQMLCESPHAFLNTKIEIRRSKDMPDDQKDEQTTDDQSLSVATV